MKKYNSLLAVLCFTCFIGYELSRLPAAYVTAQFLGSEALAAYSVGNSLINLATLFVSIIALIAIFKPNQVFTVICCIIELLFALLCIATPDILASGFGVDEYYYTMTLVYLRMSGIIILVVAAVSIPLKFMMNKVDFKLYFIISIAGAVVSILLPWFMVSMIGFGIQGLAFSNIIQPLVCLVPMILLNSQKNMVMGSLSAAVNPPAQSQHSYLDEYKKKMKGE